MGRGKYPWSKIAERLPAGRVLLEPFVGRDPCFSTRITTPMCSTTSIRISLVSTTTSSSSRTVHREARKLFVAEHNHKTAYYRLRTQFNQTAAGFERAQLFLF